jgi:YVTN family beta-propeller protein
MALRTDKPPSFPPSASAGLIGVEVGTMTSAKYLGPRAQVAVGLVAVGLLIACACPAEAQTPSGYLSADQVTGAALNANDRSAVVLIHGWTGQTLLSPPVFQDSFAKGDWGKLRDALYTRLNGTGTRLLLFHWEDDASTGRAIDFNPADFFGAFDRTGFKAGFDAANSGLLNGNRLAAQLDLAAPELRRVTFIAHSAGAWVTYQAVDRLLKANPFVVVNVVLLDPFIPGVDPALGTSLTTATMGSLKKNASEDRMYRLENYFAIDWTDNVGMQATSQTFIWRGRDINRQIDYIAYPFGAPFHYYGPFPPGDIAGHAGPIRFYADSVVATTPGASVPDGLAQAPWDFTSVGFYRGLVNEGFLLPSITVQPTAPTQPVAAGSKVSLSVSANRADSFQWFKNGEPYAGTSSVLVFNAVNASDAGAYVVRVKNKDGYTFSEKVVLQVSLPDTAFLLTENPRDSTQFQPGAVFTKTWTLKNNGTNTWNSGYRLRYVKGSLSTSRTERSISGTVAPGASYQFSVPMRAPSTPATYREDWQLVSPGGQIVAVGSSQSIYSIISVVAASGGNKPTGYFDSLSCQGGYGWAWDPDLPNTPVTIQLREGATVLQSFVAGESRPDLSAYGNGQHAFNFLTPSILFSGISRQVRAFAISQGQETELFNSPRSITCSSPTSDCSYVLSPAGSRTSPASGGSDSVSVTTGASCGWRVRSDAPWLAVTGATDRSGSQSVSYSTAANTATSRRVGTLIVEGNGKVASLTVTQDGAPGNCSYSLSASERGALWEGIQDTVTVQTTPGCTWTATALDPWLTLLDSQGTGSRFMTWFSARNTDTSTRVGTIQIYGAGTTLTLLVRQDSYPTYWPHIDVATNVSTGKSLPRSTAYQSVVIRNTGNTYLRIAGLEQVAGSAEFTGQLAETFIENGGTTSISFAFSPTSLGSRSATFRVTSNDPDRPSVDVTVTGEGVDRTTGGTDLLWIDLPVTDDASQNFRFASVVAIGNSVYVMGGSGRLYRYDPTINLWTRLADPPLGLFEGGAAVIDGRIYLIAGYGEARVQIFDPAAGTWTIGSPIPTLRQGVSVAAANGRLYTFGGGRTGTVEEYDPATNSWRRRADMTARDYSTAQTIDNRVYVIGGNGDGVDVAEVYDPVANTWTRLEDMPTRRRLVKSVAVGPRIFVVGGLDMGGLNGVEAAVTTVDELNTSLPDPHPFPGFHDVWFSRNPIGHPRYGASAVAVNGRIYVIGGEAASSQGGLPVHIVEQGTFAADPDVNVPVTSGDFGNIPVGRPAELAFEVQNRGSALLTLTYRWVSGTDDVRAVETANNVAAGTSKTIHLRFRPSVTGSQTARLEIVTNDPDTPVIPLTVSGIGITPTPQVGGAWKVTRTLPIGGNASSLRSVAVSAGKAYITHSSDGGGGPRLTVVDLATGTVDGDIAVTSTSSFPGADVNQVAVAGGTAYLPLGNLGSDGRLAVVNLATRAVQAYVGVGVDPFGVVTLGTSAFVSNSVTWSNGDPATVRVIDTVSNAVTNVIPVGVAALLMAADPITGRVYVANAGGSISVIDAAQRQVVASIPVESGPRGGPRGVAISGPQAFISTGPFVKIVNTSSNAIVGSIAVEDDTFGMAADEHHVFAATSGGNAVTVIDPVTNSIAGIVPVPNRGYVSIDPDTGSAWVVRSDQAAISAIEFVNTGLSFTCSPETSRLVAGDHATITCGVSSVDGFASAVDLSCAGVPPGVACLFAPAHVVLTANGSAQTTLTLSGAETTLPGVYRITLTGTSGAVVQSAVTSLTVSSCDVLLPAASMSVPGTASDASVDMQNANGCRWTAEGQAAFLRITSPTSGLGSALISFHVDANRSGQPRTGVLTLGGRAFTVTQAAGDVAAPSITLQPALRTAALGGMAIFTAAATGTPTPTVQWQVSTNGGSTFGDVSGATATTYAFVAAAADTGKQFRAVFTNSAGTATSSAATLTVTVPTMALEKTSLVFSAINNGAAFGAQTSPQTVRLTQTGAGTVTWTAVSTTPWLVVSPTSGSGSATLTISTQFASGLTASQTGRINLAFTGSGNTAGPITVTLTSLNGAQAAAPTGSFDTPTDGTTGVTGSIAVTGWAMDDVEVTGVRILRDPVAGEPAGTLVLIGNAVLVDGARPDVQALFPTAPRNTRAGWGYLMLTNFLPNLGNGTFKLTAIADDADGHATTLGTKTITCTNATATAPTGAIDTPAQGGTISGTVTNFGWVLSPSPRRADPPGGGTVRIVIDGAFISAVPSGWTSRSDLTALFPAAQYPGIVNALGVAVFDSTALANGVHTISWVVTDNLGSASGIGSRYFTVSNGALFLDPTPGSATRPGSMVIGGPTALALPPAAALRLDSAASLATAVDAAPGDVGAIHGRRGFNLETPLRAYAVRGGRATVQAEELDRIELHLEGVAGSEGVEGPQGRVEGTVTGYQRVGDGLAPLPAGSALDASTGALTWMPGVGFVGTYDLVFVRWAGGQAVARQDVRVVLNPMGSTRVGPQTVIDTPSSALGTAVVEPSFVLAGWAADLDATTDRGVDTVHVWAYPATPSAPSTSSGQASSGQAADPIWIGAATYGGARPDVAAVYGDRFLTTGYGITVQGLAPGTYDLAVFAYSTVTGGFVPAKTVRVTVR